MELRRLLSSLAAVGILYVVYGWLHLYDWGQPFAKLICFSIIFALVLHTRNRRGSSLSNTPLLAVECALLLAGLTWVLVHDVPLYLKQLSLAPKVDIGYTTENAATMLFRGHSNPYSSAQINVRPELLPRFRGFHYGPLMLFGYAAGVFSPGLGFKLSSLIFSLGTMGALALALWRTDVRGMARANTIVCFVLLALLSERTWYELFQQGANDIFPVLLLALAVPLLQAEKWGAVGVLIGLSFSAKFSPAIFFLVALIRRRPRPAIFVGFAIGCIPLVLFLAWNARGALNNIFIVRFLLRYDSTSLYSITPLALHFLFPLGQLAAVLVAVWKDFDAPLTAERVVSSFLLVLIVEEVCFKEMHANHLIWFVPFVAYIVARHRYGYLSARDASLRPTPR